jgi:Zn-dependent protease with chaperone function
MGLYLFLNSYWGIFIVQSFLHSFIAMIVINVAVRAWRLESPVIRQRFFFMVILTPVLSVHLFQALDRARGTVGFRSGALFDSMRWLNLEIAGTVPLGAVLIFLLGLTSVIFFFQEFLPVLKQTFPRKHHYFEMEKAGEDPRVEEALKGLPGEKGFPGERPRVRVLEEDDEFLIFSKFGSSPTIFVSTGLLDGLDAKQLRAALAHEMVHIRRSRRPILVVIFLLRMLMFFNPIILLEFRRIVQEEEKICDEKSVSMTGDARALADTLSRFEYKDGEAREGNSRLAALGGILEEYSHNFLIEERIRRLIGRKKMQKSEPHFFKMALTFSAILLLTYFVV